MELEKNSEDLSLLTDFIKNSGKEKNLSYINSLLDNELLINAFSEFLLDENIKEINSDNEKLLEILKLINEKYTSLDLNTSILVIKGIITTEEIRNESTKSAGKILQ